MMSVTIRHEAAVFLLFAAHGAILSLLYDGLCAVRIVFGRKAGRAAVGDFFYWMVVCFSTFRLACLGTSGVLRLYLGIGAGIGAVLYRQIARQHVVDALVFLLRFVKKAVSLPFEAAAFVIRRIRTYLWRLLHAVEVRSQNILHPMKKRLRTVFHVVGKPVFIIVNRLLTPLLTVKQWLRSGRFAKKHSQHISFLNAEKKQHTPASAGTTRRIFHSWRKRSKYGSKSRSKFEEWN